MSKRNENMNRYNRRRHRKNRPNNDNCSPGDFRQIPVCPTYDEMDESNAPTIESNIIKGKYNSVDHYLEIQFNLLREDFVRPLRKGIKSIKSEDIQDLKVYENVKILKESVYNKAVPIMASIGGKQVEDIDWEKSKRLIRGSLVCLSANNFQKFYFASVADNRKVIKSAENKIRIEFKLKFEFESESVSIDPNIVYVMMESDAYFEAYRHNLIALQRFNSNNFPLKQYIIDVNNDVSNPSYISSYTEYDLSHMIVHNLNTSPYVRSSLNNSNKKVRLLDSNQWPNEMAFGFDEAQYLAFKAALLKQLVLIQGPPGTGKTYIGLKIVETLYINRIHNSQPILIVCYTNHALDQFLEGILPFCQNLVRIGGRSQSEKLEKFTLKSIRDFRLIARKSIIGMTTTGAAKFRDVLESIDCKIVIIEEAAEVLESHVITSLTKNTEHLILIGDHKQLRPKTSDYSLTKAHHLDVSLFERLINNGMPFNQLILQHRMRPEISKLLVPHIYDQLFNDISVEQYDDIKGIKKNMFFISHSHFESENVEKKSKSNEFEAKFIVRLAKHLLYQNYESSKITILTLYSAQQLIIVEMLEQKKMSINCQVLDGFQGEENDIILVSFVRSNSQNNIGFLDVSNRVNVALSRAKKGLYCIGNFNSFAKRSKLWKNITNCLKKSSEIGSALELKCWNHPNQVINVSNPEDFNSKSPFGGCTQPCILMCGHLCPFRICHIYSQTHDCQQKCLKLICERRHLCPNICHYPVNCKPCSVPVVETIAKCGHRIEKKCSEKSICYKPCERRLGCGHRCYRNCADVCQLECHQIVNLLNPICGHSIRKLCYQSSYCYHICERTLKCGHKCNRRCGDLCLDKCVETDDICLWFRHMFIRFGKWISS